MSDEIFAEMREQMTPDDKPLQRLDAALAAEDALMALAGDEPAAEALLDDAGSIADEPPRRPRISRTLLLAAAGLVVAALGFAALFSGGLPAGQSQQEGNGGTGPTALAEVYTASDYAEVYDQLAARAYWGEASADREEAADQSGIFAMESADDSLDPGGGPAAPSVTVTPQAPNLPSLAIGPMWPDGDEEEDDPAAADPDADPADADPAAADPADADPAAPDDDADADPAAADPDYSDTNSQVAGIAEGDIVKTDGRHIYALSSTWDAEGYKAVLSIFEAAGASTSLTSKTFLAEGVQRAAVSPDQPAARDQYPDYHEMFICGDALVIVSTYTSIDYEPAYKSVEESVVEIYDISDPAQPRLAYRYSQSGRYQSARLADGVLYILSVYHVWEADADAPETFVPLFTDDGQTRLCPPQDIAIMPQVDTPSYAVIGSLDVAGCRPIDQASVLGAGDVLYMSAANLYVAAPLYDQSVGEPYSESVYTVTEYSYQAKTQITRVAISAGKLDIAAQAIVEGRLLNQFALDEYGGNLRLAVTIDNTRYKVYVDESVGIESWQTVETPASNAVYVLEPSLDVAGSLGGLGVDEYIYSVRFMGPVCYMVTFRQVDPLFAIDLSDPANPRQLSALKIPGFSNYLHPWSEGLLLGIGQAADDEGVVSGMKLSMFDVSDPTAVSELDVLPLDCWYSEALYIHKAVLAAPERGLIGFGGDSGNYLVYGYGSSGFVLQGDLKLGDPAGPAGSYYSWHGVRGFYIDGCLYVFSGSYLNVFDLETLEPLAALEIIEMGYGGMPIMPGGGLPTVDIE